MDAKYVVVFQTEVVGLFESEADAREYVELIFGGRKKAAADLTWSIKPVRAP